MEYIVWFIASFLFFIINNSNQLFQPSLLSLSETQWIVKNKNGSINISANIPGGIYTDLSRERILQKDIFYKDNDIKYRWVANESWSYSTTFTVENELLKKDYIWLVFHGVDTIASVFLNNVLLGKTDNMFVRYRFDIKSLLQNGANTLELNFDSPIASGLKFSNQYYDTYNYTVPPHCTMPVQHGECHVNFLRKMQASFSWDWGPAFPSVGIWKDVEIEAFNSVIIRSISVNVNLTNEWEVSGVVYMDTFPNKNISADAQINIYMPHGSKPVFPQSKNFRIETNADANGEASFNFSRIVVNKDLVKLWWPNGYGDQSLYLLSVIVVSSNEVTSFTTKFGFRNVKLVQKPVDAAAPNKGLTFYFEINGVKVFAKGSNFISSHILPELSYDKYTLVNLLSAVKDTHMNMLRVWGGGLYESDLFYKLCDEMGIMLWQDMMFACAMYPISNNFLQSVSKEVVQNVRRLHSHPSIVVWAGNNENEAALRGNWYGTKPNFELYKSDYIKLYVNVIKKLVEENDFTRSYVVSSPSNGIESEMEGYIADDPYSPIYGDVHVYNYFSDNWDPMNVSPTRFSSEYGIQSLPSFSTLRNVADLEDLNITSPFMKLRQHHPGGYSEIEFEINLNLPGLRREDFKQYIYYSQINQAMSIKTMSEKYRTLRNTLTPDGNGLTMGALYWQLNDVWQAPSWSSIEFGGKWKMLHYFAKKFFSPVLLSPTIIFNNVTVSIVSDIPTGSSIKVTVYGYVYHYNSFQPVNEFSVTSEIKPLSSVIILNKMYTEIMGNNRACGFGSDITRRCFMIFKLDCGSELDIRTDAFLFLNRLTTISGLQKATIRLKEIKEIDRRKGPFLPKISQIFEVTITTDAVALFVWLDVGNIKGRFSENGFQLVTSEKKINFISWESVTAKELQKALTISTLKGVYGGILNV
ncbi:beta-mannosidase-like [Lycorma delicatula]|uniref:beta-mannosidase-like n=1 Tax=Lycorma delicatula TaxID=130591 RepID=UPI003F513F77